MSNRFGAEIEAMMCDGWYSEEHEYVGELTTIVHADGWEWHFCPDCLDEYSNDKHDQDEYGTEV